MKLEKTIIEKIYDLPLEEIMGDRFGKYSKEIIQDRALPDVRDGLKPVQRRILYSMYMDKNTYDHPYRKCAKAVGNIMGNYHPHGDTSIYDALIRLSQVWKMREIFVDVRGNNGSIDGDGPAAYRYTEARLHKMAEVLLKDINKDTVKMTLNYCDEELEPTVLPAGFPNLLVNGSTGISAGYATNIPPHNISEVIDATIKRIDTPNCTLETIMDIIKGPDYPTGGIVEGKDGLLNAYKTGRGKVVLKARCEIVKEKGTHKIIIHEIPYEVIKEDLKKKIEDIRIDKKIDGILDVIDESDKEHMARLVVELKKDANSELILNYLYKNSGLQVNYNFNMVAIVNRRPKTLGLLEILDAFIKHQKEVVTRRTEYELKKAEARYHIVEGLIRAMSILDEIIKVIRGSKNKSDSINNLMEKYEFSNLQAEAIVLMQLYRLSNTDVTLLMEEMAKLAEEIDLKNRILASDDALKYVMKNDLKQIKKDYGNKRRTDIVDLVTDIKLDFKEMIPEENVIVVVTNEGYVKRVSLKSYKMASDETTLKPGDFITGLFDVTTLDTLIMFTNLGNYLYIPVHKIVDGKWKDLGKHVSNLVIMSPEEAIIGSTIMTHNEDDELTLFTKNGFVKQINMSDLNVTRYSKAMTIIKLKENDELVNVEKSLENTLIVTKNGYYLMFTTNQIPVVGVKASGVKGINLKDDFVINGMELDNSSEYVNIFTNNLTAKRVKISDLVPLNRAKKGFTIMKKTKTKTYYVDASFKTTSRDINIIKKDNDIIEIKNSEIPIFDCASTGSVISKSKIDVVKLKKEIEIFDTPKEEPEEKENISLKPVKEGQLTFDDFLEDFKI
ncbi:MAG: DNA topoisomerase IV subunit A [Bacilli bacterium]